MYFFTITLSVVSIILVFNLAYALYNYIRGYPPSLSSTNKAIKNIRKAYIFKDTDYVADLGSGHGKILGLILKSGSKADGFELNPLLCLETKIRFIFNKKAKVFRKNFLDVDLSKYTVITMYLTNGLIKKLEEKIMTDGLKDKILISNKFPLNSLKPVKVVGDIYLYKI